MYIAGYHLSDCPSHLGCRRGAFKQCYSCIWWGRWSFKMEKYVVDSS